MLPSAGGVGSKLKLIHRQLEKVSRVCDLDKKSQSALEGEKPRVSQKATIIKSSDVLLNTQYFIRVTRKYVEYLFE
jgi:hypothetical protein